MLGRSYLVMADGFRRILARLPFPLRELHSDNGSEFFNEHLVRFWKEAIADLRLSRNRPYQKNDNPFVEQKQSTLVRAYLGYDRLDSVAQTNALNRLYDLMWLYYNFFQPVIRVREKILVPTAVGMASPHESKGGMARPAPLSIASCKLTLSPRKRKNSSSPCAKR